MFIFLVEGDTEEDKKKFEDTLKETLGGLNKSAGDLQVMKCFLEGEIPDLLFEKFSYIEESQNVFFFF